MIVPKVGFHRGDVCGQRTGRGESAQCQMLSISSCGPDYRECLSKEIAVWFD